MTFPLQLSVCVCACAGVRLQAQRAACCGARGHPNALRAAGPQPDAAAQPSPASRPTAARQSQRLSRRGARCTGEHPCGRCRQAAARAATAAIAQQQLPVAAVQVTAAAFGTAAGGSSESVLVGRVEGCMSTMGQVAGYKHHRTEGTARLAIRPHPSWVCCVQQQQVIEPNQL